MALLPIKARMGKSAGLSFLPLPPPSAGEEKLLSLPKSIFTTSTAVPFKAVLLVTLAANAKATLVLAKLSLLAMEAELVETELVSCDEVSKLLFPPPPPPPPLFEGLGLGQVPQSLLQLLQLSLLLHVPSPQ